MQRQKLNHALRRAEPCKLRSPTMQVAERNHALSRVHGSARAFPSIETFFSFLTWVLAQRAIATPMPFGVSKRILQSPCKRFRGNLSLPKRWDNFAPSQSQTLLQAKRELDFKSNSRFTSSGNGGSLKAKRRHRLGALLAATSGRFLKGASFAARRLRSRDGPAPAILLALADIWDNLSRIFRDKGVLSRCLHLAA